MAIILDAVIAFFAAVGVCTVIGMVWGIFKPCLKTDREAHEITDTGQEDTDAG